MKYLSCPHGKHADLLSAVCTLPPATDVGQVYSDVPLAAVEPKKFRGVWRPSVYGMLK